MKTYFSDIKGVLKIYLIERFVYALWLMFVPGPGSMTRLPYFSFLESFF